MPPNHLILCPPLGLLPSIFLSIRVFSNESVLHIRRSKYWSISFSISPSNEYSGLIFSKGLSRVFSNTTVQKHQFFDTQLSSPSNSHPYMTTGKTIALARWAFVRKVTSLLFNMLKTGEHWSGLPFPSLWDLPHPGMVSWIVRHILHYSATMEALFGCYFLLCVEGRI